MARARERHAAVSAPRRAHPTPPPPPRRICAQSSELHQALPSARAATVNLLNDMYGRVVPEGSASIEALGTYNDAHDVLDKDLPVKFEEA